MIDQPIEHLTRSGCTKAITIRRLKAVVLKKGAISLQNKARAIVPRARLIVREVIAWIDSQNHQVRMKRLGLMAPSEQGLTSAISTNSKIQQLSLTTSQQRAILRTIELMLQLTNPVFVFIHLKRLRKGVSKHRNPKRVLFGIVIRE